MYDAADSILAQKLSQVEGVGQVMVGGGAKPAVRVELNAPALEGFRIGLDQVRTTLAAANALSPKGSLADRNRTEFYRLLQKHGLTPGHFKADALSPGGDPVAEERRP